MNKEQKAKNKREAKKLLDEYKKKFGSDSCVFIPKDKEGYGTIKSNLEYTIEELKALKRNSIERREMEIKLYKKILKSK